MAHTVSISILVVAWVICMQGRSQDFIWVGAGVSIKKFSWKSKTFESYDDDVFVCSQIRLENIIVNVKSSDFIILINMIIPYLLTQSRTPLQQTSINFLKFWFRIFWNWNINISWNWDVGISGWQCCITSIGFWIIQFFFLMHNYSWLTYNLQNK